LEDGVDHRLGFVLDQAVAFRPRHSSRLHDAHRFFDAVFRLPVDFGGRGGLCGPPAPLPDDLGFVRAIKRSNRKSPKTIDQPTLSRLRRARWTMRTRARFLGQALLFVARLDFVHTYFCDSAMPHGLYRRAYSTDRLPTLNE
jgi:hypothetical protein